MQDVIHISSEYLNKAAHKTILISLVAIDILHTSSK